MSEDAVNPKPDLRRSRISRQLIRDSFTEAARKRESLALQLRTGPVKGTLQIVERLKNGDAVLTVVDYDGAVMSEVTKPHDEFQLRSLSRKPIREKPLINSVFYVNRITDIWYSGPSN